MRVDAGNSGVTLENILLSSLKKSEITSIKHKISSMEFTGLIKENDYKLNSLTFNNHPLGEIRVS